MDGAAFNGPQAGGKVLAEVAVVDEEGAGELAPDARELLPTVMRAADLARLDCRVLDISGRDVTERKERLSPGVYFLRSKAATNDTKTTKVILQ
mgnify:CR=1 FL=1